MHTRHTAPILPLDVHANLCSTQLMSFLPNNLSQPRRFPRSMPPPAPPRRELPAAEVAQLARLRGELQAVKDARELRVALKLKAQQSALDRREQRAAWRRQYADLYTRLAAKQLTVTAVSRRLKRDIHNTWDLLHGRYQPGEIRWRTLEALSRLLCEEGKPPDVYWVVRYLTHAHRVWKETHHDDHHPK